MSKLPFTKLALKRNDEVKTFAITDSLNIEVKQYLPVNEKLQVISNILNQAVVQDEFVNPVKIELFGALEIIQAYTNLTFTEKQKEDPAKLYDLLESNKMINAIINCIPRDEYNFMITGIDDSVKAFYDYKNSVVGVLETIQQNYKNLEYDVSKLQSDISNPENLALLKEVLTKLG